MTRQQLIQSIYDIMENSLELPTLSSFNEDARLNGIAIPDEVLVPKDFKTVGTLASFLEKQQKVE